MSSSRCLENFGRISGNMKKNHILGGTPYYYEHKLMCSFSSSCLDLQVLLVDLQVEGLLLLLYRVFQGGVCGFELY